ncbi:MAG: PIN domain-containing protein [Lachnospiraceae bacterium]|nr:PIN domain-containing protein [Lachnospiraceae bacterium]
MEKVDGLQFLIDYENVHEQGFEGMENLYQTDSVSIFYSECCKNISRQVMNYILSSGCFFYTFKLKKGGKNALDFYIVSRVGEMIGAGYEGQIVIVSRDKGYSAARDYWFTCGIPYNRIILSASVKEGILASNENSLRRRKIVADAETVCLDTEYARYEERAHIKDRLITVFRGTEYEEELPKICEVADGKQSPKELYLSSIKEFGKADGTKIYRYLKNAAG